MKSYEIFEELLEKQRIKNNFNCLSFYDLKRISKKIKRSIFSNRCVKWHGYIRKDKKYISFFFNDTKRALHRLLYINFVEPLGENQYLRFTCKNKGICCNINHMKKMNKIKPPRATRRKIKRKLSNNDLILSFD